MAIRTRSGPAEIVFDPDAVLFSAPVTITREQQMGEATLTSGVQMFEHRTQNSASPHRRIKTGVNVGLQISISDVENFNLLAIALGTRVIEGSGANAGKSAVMFRDDAGLDFDLVKVLIKPVVGQTVATNPEDWLIMPAAQLCGSEDFSLVFGLETQQSFTINVLALPDDNGIKLYRGSEAVLNQLFGGTDYNTAPGTTPGGGTGGTGGTTYDTTITIATTGTAVTQETVTFNASAGDTFQFNKLSTATGSNLPASMNLKVGGNSVGTVAFTQRYLNQPFKVTIGGTVYSNKNFVDGDVNL